MKQINFALVLAAAFMLTGCKGPPVEQQMKQIEEEFRREVDYYFQQKGSETAEMRDLQKPYYTVYAYYETASPEDAYANLTYAVDEEEVLSNIETLKTKGEKIANFVLIEATEPSKPFKARVRYERSQWVKDESVEWTIESKNSTLDEERLKAQQAPPKEGEQPKDIPKKPPQIRPLYRKDSAVIVEQDFIFTKGVLSPEGIVKETPKEEWKKDLGPWKTEQTPGMPRQ